MINKTILQILNIEKNCKGIFCKGKIMEPSSELVGSTNLAWKYSPILQNDEQRYTFLYLLKKDEKLENFCQDPELYEEYQNKIFSHRKASIAAKIDLSQACFLNILPQHQLLGWLSSRETALQNCLLRLEKQEDYEILHKAHVLTTQISSRKLYFNEKPGSVIYDIFGSATGRLTTKKNSIPVLTLKRNEREGITPQNDAFVELDLNAAEVRMLLALSGKEQPREDIHQWTSREIFSSNLTREEVKKKTFAWLYNFSAPKNQLDKFFSRQIFRDFFDAKKEILTTPFGRKLKVDERRAQNYLLQSTTSDQVIANAYNIEKMLKNKKSSIAFTLHDSIILDMAKEDAIMLRDIKSQFEKTRWGTFSSTCKIGKNFGNLKEIKF
ncbi:MAG: hypothetical protein CBD16_05145 [Betaproteobacteria bacterium TMED156]|nr:MAG: hypothetical protein CBD16_07165 [Betaproteobacteria bacterium TMED156]OUW01652.1 MAG: hypothetical protein CBD16_05145 [Betaproteobacteria bacterium TMED156]